MTIQEYLQKYKTNIYQLSTKAGINSASISRMLNGPRTTVSPETAAKISAATNGKVSIQEILFPNGIPPQSRMSPRRKVK